MFKFSFREGLTDNALTIALFSQVKFEKYVNRAFKLLSNNDCQRVIKELGKLDSYGVGFYENYSDFLMVLMFNTIFDLWKKADPEGISYYKEKAYSEMHDLPRKYCLCRNSELGEVVIKYLEKYFEEEEIYIPEEFGNICYKVWLEKKVEYYLSCISYNLKEISRL